MEINLNNPDIKLEQLSKSEAYKNSTLLEKFRLQQEKKEFGDFLVAAFSDIDGTFIYVWKPNEEDRKDKQEELVAFREAFQRVRFQWSTERTTQFLEEHHVPIIAVTGRDLKMVQEDQRLPMFDGVASAVGTEVYSNQKDGTYQLDDQFDSYLRQDIGYKREEVYQVCAGFQHNLVLANQEIKLEFQPRDRVGSSEQPQPYKISFNFEGDQQTVDMLNSAEGEQSLRAVLNENGFQNVKLVFSWDRDLGGGRSRYNIDVVPLTKKDAVDYLAKKFGCLAFTAGDSGNDKEMIFESETAGAGIVVGGAKDELRRALDVLKGNLTRETPHFISLRDDRLLFKDIDSSRRGPESLLKAIRAFRLLNVLKSK